MKPLAFVLGAAAAVLLAVLSFVLWGDSGVHVDTGPLGGGPVNGLECGPGRTVFDATDALQNTTDSPIRIEKFMLVDPRGVKLIGVDLVPIGQVPLIGFGFGWPPDDVRKATWARRRTLPMTIPPSRDTRWNLVFGLERTAKTGTLTDDEVLYEYQGAQYLWTSDTAVRVVSTASCPSNLRVP